MKYPKTNFTLERRWLKGWKILFLVIISFLVTKTFKSSISRLWSPFFKQNKDIQYDQKRRKFTGYVEYDHGGILDPKTSQIIVKANYELYFHEYFIHVVDGKITMYNENNTIVTEKVFPGKV